VGAGGAIERPLLLSIDSDLHGQTLGNIKNKIRTKLRKKQM
jgi:protein involved in polysaccharide export with SLBB domain